MSEIEYTSNFMKYRESISDSSEKIINSTVPGVEKKLLFVEGDNDEILYQKFSNKNAIEIVIVNKKFRSKKIENIRSKLKEEVNEENKRFFGGRHGYTSTKDAIIIIIAKNFDKKTFYGIVDKDYDSNNKDIIKIQKNYENVVDLSEHLISTDTNDAETLIFKNDMCGIQKSAPTNCSQEVWKEIIDKAIRKSCKLGYIRKKNHDNSKELTFKSVFKSPEDFVQYAKDDDSVDIKNAIKEVLKKCFMEKDFSYWINDIPTKFDNKEWNYCRGHDLTGIIASLMYIENISFDSGNALQETQIQLNEKKLIERIMGNLDVENFKKSKVIIWLKKIQEEAENENP